MCFGNAVRASRPIDQKAALLKSRVRSTRSLLRSTRPLPVLVGWHETATRVRSMKNRRSYQMLVALFLALVPASGVLAQVAGPDYAVAPSVEYGPLFRDVQLRAIFPDSKSFPDLVPNATP